MTVEEAFGSYLIMAYPDQKIEGMQLIEIRRAFYAGVGAALNGIDSPDDIVPMLEECERFKQDVLGGKK